MIKTNMIRKASNLEEIIPKDSFVIKKVIELNYNDFHDFKNDFYTDRDFIKNNKDLMYRDKNFVDYGIAVITPSENYTILVQSEGYNYARYTGYLDYRMHNIKSRKVIDKFEPNNDSAFRCPSCDNLVYWYDNVYCHKCGLKLDWSEIDEKLSGR